MEMRSTKHFPSLRGIATHRPVVIVALMAIHIFGIVCTPAFYHYLLSVYLHIAGTGCYAPYLLRQRMCYLYHLNMHFDFYSSSSRACPLDCLDTPSPATKAVVGYVQLAH